MIGVGVWNVPSSLPSSTSTSFSHGIATQSSPAAARSSRPSPVKSPATRARMGFEVAQVDRRRGLERPVTIAQQHLHRLPGIDRPATARSARPSPVKSPATREEVPSCPG